MAIAKARVLGAGGEKIYISGELTPEFRQILTPEALQFVARLQRLFGPMRDSLLKRRIEVQEALSRGAMPDFMRETRKLREADWTIAPVPAEVRDRRVEITGPVDRKMIINAMNSGASVFMADFEDSLSPTWSAVVQGQINLRDAINRTIDYTSPEGKHYRLGERTAVLFVRPRGWHLDEKHVEIDGKPVSASLFDFGLYFFHNARRLIGLGQTPYFYLPKMENHLEARLWNDVFVFAQKELGIARGTIKATVLIETILAAFQMQEILWELREHSAGLNCGRWDYIFSFIKKFQAHTHYVLPDRATVTMDVPFLKSYSLLLIQSAHRRGAHAMGGMAAQIPIKDDLQAHNIAMMRVREDKMREVSMGHDGTWVAHPGLVPLARECFDKVMAGPNQIRLTREDVDVRALDLLTPPMGDVSEEGFRKNVNVSLLYLEAWLRGSGSVPLYHLMEDAATAEISRAQLWQWIRHRHGQKAGDITLSYEGFKQELDREYERIRMQLRGDELRVEKLKQAHGLLDRIVADDRFVEFLTLPAYELLD